MTETIEKCMDYLEAKYYVRDNIEKEKELYVYVKENARMHIYTEQQSVTWYNVDMEIKQNGEYVVESRCSDCEIKELLRLVGMAWIHLKELSKFSESL